MAPVPPAGLHSSDITLYNSAVSLLSTHYIPGRHEVSTSFLLSSGEMVQGIHVEGSCGRSSICAEGMALGASLLKEEEDEVVAIVAVLYVASTGKIRMIAPCGLCRELLFDYCPKARCYTWLPSDVKDPPITIPITTTTAVRQTGEKGFDLDNTDLANGQVREWKVKDLLPDKTKRVGW